VTTTDRTTTTNRPAGPGPRDRLLAAAIEHFSAHGVSDHSLRAVANAIGTSHRMLIYHFGSRDGLLAEVVRAVEEQQRDALTELLADSSLTPGEQSRRFWHRVADATLVHGRLFFELSALALQDKPYTRPLRDALISIWLEPLASLYLRVGVPAEQAPTYARLGLATARGLLFDLLATDDRTSVDQAAALLDRLTGVTAGGV
jgi:AcrR family transcriptional regulator